MQCQLGENIILSNCWGSVKCWNSGSIEKPRYQCDLIMIEEAEGCDNGGGFIIWDMIEEGETTIEWWLWFSHFISSRNYRRIR